MTAGPNRGRESGNSRTVGSRRRDARAGVTTRATRRWADRPAVPTRSARGDALADALDLAGATVVVVLVVARRWLAVIDREVAAGVLLVAALAAMPPGLGLLVLAGPAVVATATALPFLVVRLTVRLLERRQS